LGALEEPTACHPERGFLPESEDLPRVGRSLRPSSFAEGGIDPRTVRRFFESLADSVAQNDMSMGVVKPYVGVAKRRGGVQGDMCFSNTVFPLVCVAKRRGETQTEMVIANGRFGGLSPPTVETPGRRIHCRIDW
jgi:hypothetical protein